MKYVLMFASTMDAQDRYEQLSKAELGAMDAAVRKWFEENGGKGLIVGGEELQGPRTATTVRFADGKAIVTDGPFIEAKEVIGGFAIVDVKDLDEALALARTWPAGGAVEVRPLVDHSAH
jgi:hypothetical protein